MTIKVDGIGRVTNNLTNLSRRLPKATKRGLWLATNRLAKRLREAAPFGIGGPKSMKSTGGTYARKVDKNSYGIFMPSYTLAVEGGTQPHVIGRNWRLDKWANMRGYNPAKLRRSIAYRGTKAHPFTQRTMIRTLPEMREIIIEQINNAIRGGK